MNKVQDRKKQRREYLRKKAMIYALPVMVAAGTVVSIYNLLGPDFTRTQGVASTIWAVIPCGFLVVLSWAHYSKARRDAARITHVPPVTPVTLPADEILVRGAEEPSAPNGTLLRATVKGETTNAEELLRVVSGSSGEQTEAKP
jgi:hypothetical protein